MSHLDSLPPGEQEAVKKLLAETKARHDKLLAELPEEVRRLGNIIRMSLKFGSTRGLEKYLRKLGFPMDSKEYRQIEKLRDVLILNRSDLSDLAPMARQRLRVVYLRNQPGSAMTEDYALALHMNHGLEPRCSGCQYFGHPPSDEGPDAKPCISLGARGTDLACFGFTRILQP